MRKLSVLYVSFSTPNTLKPASFPLYRLPLFVTFCSLFFTPFPLFARDPWLENNTYDQPDQPDQRENESPEQPEPIDREEADAFSPHDNNNNTNDDVLHVEQNQPPNDDTNHQTATLQGASDNNTRRTLRPTRRPTNYEPSFSGRRYNMQLFNYSIKTVPKAFNDGKHTDLRSTTFNLVFTQMTADRGIKEVGEKAIAAIFKEYKQIDDLNVIGPLTPENLSNDQKRRALRAVNLIKLKRCGKVKGRLCANGAPHRKFIPREEAKSPTVSLDGLFGVALIAANERRHVMSFDVPGAYLHADIPEDKFRVLKLEGRYVDIMCDVNPEYVEYIHVENGRKVLYV